MAEIIEGKSKEQEAMDLKLQEAVHDLEEATTREMMLRQQVRMQDEQLKILQDESEDFRMMPAGPHQELPRRPKSLIAVV